MSEFTELTEFVRRLDPANPTFVERARLVEADGAAYVQAFAEEMRLRGIARPVSNLRSISVVDGLIEGAAVVEIDAREIAEAVIDSLSSLPVLPARRVRVSELLGDFSLGGAADAFSAREVILEIDARLESADVVLRQIDFGSDSFAIVAIASNEVEALERAAAAAALGLRRFVRETNTVERTRNVRARLVADRAGQDASEPADPRARQFAEWIRSSDLEMEREDLEEGESMLADAISTGRTDGILDGLCDIGDYTRRNLYRRIWSGESAAWDDFRRVVAFRALRYSLEPLDDRARPSDVALVLLDAIAYGDRAVAESIAARLAARLERPSKEWKASKLAGFASALVAVRAGENRATSLASPFNDLVATWMDGVIPSDILDRCAEFHAETGKLGFHDEQEFVGLFSLIPVEFVALDQVRAEKGLARVAPTHPYFGTPLARYAERPGRFDSRSDATYISAVEALRLARPRVG